MRRLAVLMLFPLVACGGPTSAPVASPGAPPVATPVASAAAPAASSAVVAPPPAPATFEAEQRQILDEMVATDTSHGGETKLLEPIAARFRSAGVPVQILESSPGRGNLVARLKGSGAKQPLLLLAHVDVVPIDGQPWTVKPFETAEKDGFLYGRGVNDDKGMAATIVAVTLELARAKTPLTRDVIVALTAGEETGGDAGTRWLVETHKDLLDAAIALNEGGAVRMSDDLAKPLAIGVGVSEKLFQTFRVVAHGKGGHSSQPPTTGDPVVALAHALVRVGDLRFTPRVLPAVKADFELQSGTAEKKYVDALRHAAASAPRIAPADVRVLSESAAYNAAIRTTCVTTMLRAAPQDNVLPTTAEATINCRILPGETPAEVQAALTRAIADPKLEVTADPSVGGAAASPFDGEVVDAVKKSAAVAFPGTPVIPAMGSGATDSRFLRGIGIRAYGVAPNSYTLAEGKSAHVAHGPDERRPIALLAPLARYFRDVVRALAE